MVRELTDQEKREKHAAYMRIWYRANREKAQAIARASWTRNADKKNARRRAYSVLNRESVNGAQREYRARHPESHRAYQREYRRTHLEYERAYRNAHPERVAAWKRRSRENHPDQTRLYRATHRARKRGAEGRHTVEEWLSKLDLVGGCCIYCGRSDRPLTRDHKMPLSRGGSDAIDNVVPACRNCNASKARLTILEYLGVCRATPA